MLPCVRLIHPPIYFQTYGVRTPRVCESLHMSGSAIQPAKSLNLDFFFFFFSFRVKSCPGENPKEISTSWFGSHAMRAIYLSENLSGTEYNADIQLFHRRNGSYVSDSVHQFNRSIASVGLIIFFFLLSLTPFLGHVKEGRNKSPLQITTSPLVPYPVPLIFDEGRECSFLSSSSSSSAEESNKDLDPNLVSEPTPPPPPSASPSPHPSHPPISPRKSPSSLPLSLANANPKSVNSPSLSKKGMEASSAAAPECRTCTSSARRCSGVDRALHARSSSSVFQPRFQPCWRACSQNWDSSSRCRRESPAEVATS